ncbi:hypothetical protein ACLOJK_026668 [Asimina triloba]
MSSRRNMETKHYKPEIKCLLFVAMALDYLYVQIKDPSEAIFIEEEPREGLLIEQLRQTIREMTDEIGNMCTEIRRLKALANEFERQQKQEEASSDEDSTQDSTARSTSRIHATRLSKDFGRSIPPSAPNWYQSNLERMAE